MLMSGQLNVAITCIFIKTIWTLIKFCQTAEARTIKQSKYAILLVSNGLLCLLFLSPTDANVVCRQ